MTTMSFVELNLLQKAGIDASEYEDLPYHLTRDIYSDILDEVPCLKEDEVNLFNELADDPSLRELIIATSSLYSAAKAVDNEKSARTIEAALNNMLNPCYPSGESWLDLCNQWTDMLPFTDYQAYFSGKDHQLLKVLRVWLNSYMNYQQNSITTYPHFLLITELQVSLCAFLRFEPVVPAVMRQEWTEIAKKTQRIISETVTYSQFVSHRIQNQATTGVTA